MVESSGLLEKPNHLHTIKTTVSTFDTGQRVPSNESERAQKRESPVATEIVTRLSFPKSGRRDSKPRLPEPHTRFAKYKPLLQGITKAARQVAVNARGGAALEGSGRRAR
jgi:hypothetical protein